MYFKIFQSIAACSSLTISLSMVWNHVRQQSTDMKKFSSTLLLVSHMQHQSKLIKFQTTTGPNIKKSCHLPFPSSVIPIIHPANENEKNDRVTANKAADASPTGISWAQNFTPGNFWPTLPCTMRLFMHTHQQWGTFFPQRDAVWEGLYSRILLDIAKKPSEQISIHQHGNRTKFQFLLNIRMQKTWQK